MTSVEKDFKNLIFLTSEITVILNNNAIRNNYIMEWNKLQNIFSLESIKKFSANRRYQSKTTRYRMGSYCYSIECHISPQYIGKVLREDGLDNDSKAYFYHSYNSACTFEKEPNLCANIDFKKDAFVVNKIKKGQWKFPNQLYENIHTYIIDLNLIIKTNQKFIVYLPQNKFIEKEAERQYLSYFIDLLKDENIAYAIGNVDNIKEDNRQLVILIIDLITNHERMKYIINSIRRRKEKSQPIVSYFSLMKVFNREECLFKLEIDKYDKEIKAKQSISSPIVRTQDYDEEDLIMKSLMGYGPDPEIFGF